MPYFRDRKEKGYFEAVSFSLHTLLASDAPCWQKVNAGKIFFCGGSGV